MFNTIILKTGQATLTKKASTKILLKAVRFFWIDSDPKELKRWATEDERDAKKELAAE